MDYWEFASKICKNLKIISYRWQNIVTGFEKNQTSIDLERSLLYETYHRFQRLLLDGLRKPRPQLPPQPPQLPQPRLPQLQQPPQQQLQQPRLQQQHSRMNSDAVPKSMLVVKVEQSMDLNVNDGMFCIPMNQIQIF